MEKKAYSGCEGRMNIFNAKCRRDVSVSKKKSSLQKLYDTILDFKNIFYSQRKIL